jgi:opacity protein-like surface antigen
MKNLLTSIILLLFLASPLFGQSSEEKKFAVRTSIFAHALTYNLDKNNGVGFHFGQLSTTIKKDNTKKAVNSFIGVNYGYAFDCINYDSFWIITLLGPYSTVYTTDDGSTYTYSGWGLNVVGGYGWYFENDISVLLGIGPSYATWSKESENLKSDKGYGNDVEDRVKKLSFQPISSTPFFAIGYSF